MIRIVYGLDLDSTGSAGRQTKIDPPNKGRNCRISCLKSLNILWRGFRKNIYDGCLTKTKFPIVNFVQIFSNKSWSGSGVRDQQIPGSGLTLAKILNTTGKHRLLTTGIRGFPTRIREGGNERVPGVGLPQLVPRLHKGGVQLHSPERQFLKFSNLN
jgi:hypothetical protein